MWLHKCRNECWHVRTHMASTETCRTCLFSALRGYVCIHAYLMSMHIIFDPVYAVLLCHVYTSLSVSVCDGCFYRFTVQGWDAYCMSLCILVLYKFSFCWMWTRQTINVPGCSSTVTLLQYMKHYTYVFETAVFRNCALCVNMMWGSSFAKICNE